jgi:hypothetical protein
VAAFLVDLGYGKNNPGVRKTNVNISLYFVDIAAP